jgi:protein-tyrosine-phosphatase
MAEAILRDKLKKNNALDHVTVSSAGISVWEGKPASTEALSAMALRSISSITAHRSRQITARMIAEADIVLTMTSAHKEKLHRCSAANTAKIFLLSEYAGAAEDVADPFGGAASEYEMCADELEHLIEAAWGKISALAGINRQSGEK